MSRNLTKTPEERDNFCMTKLILLALLVSLPTFAQNTDELTLESTTAPTVMEDGTDLSQAPMEEPVMEAPETAVDTVVPPTEIPAQLPETTPAELTNNSAAETTVTEAPPEIPAEEATEITDLPEATETPNPIADEDQRPEEKPEPETIVDQTPPPSISTPVITTEAPEDDRYIKHRKSHWITSFAFEGMKYELPFGFEGERKNFRDKDQELWGGRLGVGGQLYLGGGFFTTSMVETYYVGNVTQDVQVADPDVEDEEAGTVKRTGGLYGAEVSQNLGYIFEFRTKNPFMDEWAYLTFEPFVEAGLGVARAYNAVHYDYDTGPTGSGVQEKYKKRIRDELTNARIGAGFNITGRSGFFMTAKVTINRYDILKREVDSYTKQDNGTVSNPDTIEDKDVKIDPITMFSIGGGYKF